jgi:hypothetical protein
MDGVAGEGVLRVGKGEDGAGRQVRVGAGSQCVSVSGPTVKSLGVSAYQYRVLSSTLADLPEVYGLQAVMTRHEVDRQQPSAEASVL